MSAIHLFEIELNRWVGKFTDAAKNNATVEAYSPLQKGKVLKVPEVVAAAAAHKTTPAQVALRWIVQHGAVLATAVWQDDYIKEDLWGFTLTDAEMSALDAVSSL